jgi:V/A-type H+-transporting ATPase subunit I
MFNAVLNLVIDSSRFPLYSWALALIGAGFVLVFVFGNWDGNLFRSMLEGLKGIIPTFLGTVSVFADIVSYIRLWAVGLAGLAISQTVNGMAANMFGPVAGHLLAFIIGGLMGLILIFVGHSINLLMSVLSVIVHGVRLNMLEFSSHLGMEWSGYKYEPLSETAEEGKVQENTI